MATNDKVRAIHGEEIMDDFIEILLPPDMELVPFPPLEGEWFERGPIVRDGDKFTQEIRLCTREVDNGERDLR